MNFIVVPVPFLFLLRERNSLPSPSSASPFFSALSLDLDATARRWWFGKEGVFVQLYLWQDLLTTYVPLPIPHLSGGIDDVSNFVVIPACIKSFDVRLSSFLKFFVKTLTVDVWTMYLVKSLTTIHHQKALKLNFESGEFFGRSVNPFPTRGTRICPPHYYRPNPLDFWSVRRLCNM